MKSAFNSLPTGSERGTPNYKAATGDFPLPGSSLWWLIVRIQETTSFSPFRGRVLPEVAGVF